LAREDKKLGKIVPYGVYDMTTNAGFVSVGITSDTAEFVVRSIRCWRERIGRRAVRMRSNGARVRLWCCGWLGQVRRGAICRTNLANGTTSTRASSAACCARLAATPPRSPRV
jgi:hypothetical protein